MSKVLFSILFVLLTLYSVAQYITHGPVIGAVTDSSARIYLRSNISGLIYIEIDTDTSFSSSLTFSDSIRTDMDNSVIINLSGLNADTRYHMQFKINQQTDTATGSFFTFPAVNTIGNYTFVFGSCLQNLDPENMFQVMLDQDSRFFLLD